MPLPAYRSSSNSNNNHRRDRSRLGLLLASSSLSASRKTRLLAAVIMTGVCVVYSYAFLWWQPDRSFGRVYSLNEELKAKAVRRKELLKRKRRGDYVPELDEEEVPEWQRRMRAAAAGEMVWRQEQELWLGVGASGDVDSSDVDSAATSAAVSDGHSNNLRGGDAETDMAGDESSRNKKRRPRTDADIMLDLLVMMGVFALTRSILRVCVYYRQFSRMIQSQGLGTTGMGSNSIISSLPTTTTTTPSRNNSGRAALARLMVPQSIHAHATLLRNARFRAWVTQLNRTRAQHGQPPLSMESLRLVMRDSDFSSNDYEALMQFHEEATLAQSMGATQVEIDQCPQRVLVDPNDDLLTSPDHHVIHPNTNNSSSSSSSERRPAQQCPICLDAYQLQDRVRTIPCFHEFHANCIDPWLAHKAACPVCKHPVVG